MSSHRQRFLRLAVVALPFLLLNAYWVLRPAPPAPEPDGPHVIAFRTGPWDAVRDLYDGRDPGQVQRLVFRFDRTMVGPERLGRPASAGEVELTPPVDGRAFWDDPATLVFEADAPLPPGTAFAARYRDDLADLDGLPVVGDPVRRFTTGTLLVRAVRFMEFDRIGQPRFEVRFSLPVLPAELAQRLVVESGRREMAPIALSAAPARRVAFRLGEPRTGEVRVRIRGDLCAAGGDLPLGKEVVHRVEAKEALRPWIRDPVRESPTRVALAINFNRNVDRDELRRHLSIEPGTELTVEGRGSRWRIVGDFPRGVRHTLRLASGLCAGPAVLESDVRRVFHAPDRTPSLRLATRGGRYLGAGGACAIELHSVNVPEAVVTIDRIDPSHVAHRLSGVASWNQLTTRLLSRKIVPGGRLDEDHVTRLDLKALLGEEARGILRLGVRRSDRWNVDRTDVVVSDLGPTVDLGERQATVRIASIAKATPVAGVTVALLDVGGLPVAEGVTDAGGKVVLTRSRWAVGRKPAVLIATRGRDATYLDLRDARVDRSGLPVTGRPWLTDLAASVHTDRGIYRPGETLRVKAWVRAPGVETPPELPVALRLVRPDGRALPEVVLRTGDEGQVAWERELPAWGPTGAWTVQVRVPGDRELGARKIRVEEYLPDRLRVETTLPEGRLPAGAEVGLTVSAHLLAGPPATGSPVSGVLRGEPVPFRPEGWQGWRFGDVDAPGDRFRNALPQLRVDGQGRAEIPVSLPRPTGSRPYRLTAEVSVQEPGGRAVTSRVTRVLDSHPVYLGLRDAGGAADGAHRVEVVALAPDGSPAALGEVRLVLHTVTWSSWWEQRGDGSWRWNRDRDLARMSARTVALTQGRGVVDLRLPDGRDVLVRVEADGAGSATTLLGDGNDRPVERPTRIELRPERNAYGPGDEVVVGLTSPHGGRLCWQLQDADVLLEGETTLEDGTGEIRFRIPEVDAPNLHLVATVLRGHTADRSGIPRAYGVVPILLRRDRIDLVAETPESVRAGSELEVRLEARGPDGPLANADLCVILVDEGILRLTGHRAEDPGETFLGPRRCGTVRHDLYGRLLPALRHAGDARSGGGAAGDDGGLLNPVRAKRVDPLVDWRPSVRTDETGRAVVTFRMPDRVGEVRVMVLAAHGRRFGLAEEHVRLTRPLDVHAHLPRFLAPGDVVDVPLELTNATGVTGDARLRLTVEGPLEILTAPSTVPLEAGGRAVVEARLRATHAGPAVLTVEAVLGGETARQSTELPVRPAAPRTREGRGVMLRPGEEVAVGSDASFLAGTRSGTLVLSRSPIVRLGGALSYLLRYPYGCVEQTTSTAFPLLHLRTLARASGEDLDEAEIAKRVQMGVDRLLSMVTPDGGLGMWPGARTPHVWGTCYGTHFLLEARRAGHDVPEEELERLLAWLGVAARDGNRRTIVAAYALYVRSLAGRRDLQALERIAVRSADMPGWQRELLLAAGARAGGIESLPPQDAAASVKLDAMHSKTRALAIRLLAIHDRDPRSPAIANLVEALLARQVDGRWETTQENAFATLALGRICGAAGGSGVVRIEDEEVRLDGDAIVRRPDPGRSVRVRWSGPGIAWCSWQVEGVRTDEPPPEEDRGLSVRRRYLDLEGRALDLDDLRRGDVVVVELRVAAAVATEDLVLVDPLPACLEIENPAIRTRYAGFEETGDLAVARHEVRDDRLILFARLPDAKSRTWRYLARCAAAGRFAVPPVWLEAMYIPERRSLHGAGSAEVSR